MNTNSSESTEPAEVETEAEAQEKKGGDSEVGIAAENVPLAVVEDGEAGATEAATDANSEAASTSCGAEISEVKAQGEEEEREAAAVGEGGESEYAKRMASDLCIQSRKARWANRKAASKKAAAPVPPESPRQTSQNDEAASAQSLSEEFIERKLYSAVCKSPEPSAAAAPEETTAMEENGEQPQPQEQSQQQQPPPPPHFNGKARRRGNRGKNAVQRQNSRSEPEAAGKGAAPLVDEDGWETKSNKRKGRKGANSSRQNSIVNGNGVASQQHQQLRQRRQSSLEARDEEAARDDAAEGTPVAVADDACVPSAAEKAPSETAGEQPRDPEAAEPEKEEEEKEKERDGDGEESVKSEETAAALQRRKKRNKKAYRQGTQPLDGGQQGEQQRECCLLPRVYVQDGLPGTVGPLNTKVRPATELFDAATLTEVMRRGHLDTLFVQGIGCGIGVGPLMMGRIGGGRYCPPDRAHEIPEKFREQPKEEGENGENEEEGKEGGEEEEKKQRGEQEPEQPEEGQQPSVEIELD